MNNRIINIVLCGLLTLVLLSACGKKGDPQRPGAQIYTPLNYISLPLR